MFFYKERDSGTDFQTENKKQKHKIKPALLDSEDKHIWCNIAENLASVLRASLAKVAKIFTMRCFIILNKLTALKS